MDRNTYIEQVYGLMNASWVDPQTRAVFVSANFYNPNTDTHLSHVALVQFTSSFGIHTRMLTGPLGLGVFSSGLDSVLINCYIISLSIYGVFLLLTIFDLFRAKSKFEFLRKPGTLNDILLFAVVCIATGFAIDYSQIADNVKHLLEQNPGQYNSDYIDTRGLAFGINAFRSTQAVLLIFLFIKLLVLLDTNPNMSILGRSLLYAGGMLNNFLFVFVIFLVALTTLTYGIIGPFELAFSSFDVALFNTLRIMVGGYSVTSLSVFNRERTAPVVILFVAFIIGYFFLLRTFIAIISHSFATIMDKIRKRGAFWVPSVNREYKPRLQTQNGAVRKLRVTDRLGVSYLDEVDTPI